MTLNELDLNWRVDLAGKASPARRREVTALLLPAASANLRHAALDAPKASAEQDGLDGLHGHSERAGCAEGAGTVEAAGGNAGSGADAVAELLRDPLLAFMSSRCPQPRGVPARSHTACVLTGDLCA